MSRNYGGTMVANMFVKFGADTTEYQKKMRAAVTRMLFAAESLTQAGRILSTAVTAPMIAIGVASLKTAMQFEASMNKMESLVGMPAETIARWKPVVQEMAGVVGKSANELAEALFFITSNGIRTDAALKVLEATAKASAIGLGETKDVAIAATSAMNAYGEGALSAEESVAVLIGTIREGNLEAAELPSALAKLLPVASAMGIEFHEAGAGIATMSRSGTTARLAAFGLRAIMIGIQAPTKGAAAAFREAHLSAAGLKKTIREEGLVTALFQMKDATEKYDVTLKDLFPNQKAYVAALQLLGKSAEDYTVIAENMGKVVGTDVDRDFKKGANTMQRTYNQAMGDLSSAAIDLGNNLSPLIDKFGSLAKAASENAKAFNELDDYHKGLITSAATFAITIGPLLYVIGSLTRVTARFIGLSILLNLSWVKSTAKVIAETTAVQALNSQMKILGLTKKQLAGNILMAGVAGYQFGKFLDHWLEITPTLNKTFGTFGSSIESVGDALKGDTERMSLMGNAANRLATKMGEVGLANQLAAAQQAGNAREIALLTERINEKANAYNKARIKVEGLTLSEEQHADSQQAIIDAQAEIDDEETERLVKLREAHGLLTSSEVTDKMTEITNQYKDHIDSGVKLELLNKNRSVEWKKASELAREYGITTSNAFKKIGESMMETGDVTQSEYFKLFDYYIPQAINAIPGKVIHGMATMGDEVADKLTGGLDRGFADGITNYNEVYRPQLEHALQATYRGGFTGMGDELRDRIQGAIELLGPLEIDIVPNVDAFMTLYDDLQSGKIPPTGG